jgi:LemA protein
MAGIIFLVILVVIAVVLIGMYNGLVQLRVRADSSWSDIDVQLKRRHDLIPNLVETVKGGFSGGGFGGGGGSAF